MRWPAREAARSVPARNRSRHTARRIDRITSRRNKLYAVSMAVRRRRTARRRVVEDRSRLAPPRDGWSGQGKPRAGHDGVRRSRHSAQSPIAYSPGSARGRVLDEQDVAVATQARAGTPDPCEVDRVLAGRTRGRGDHQFLDDAAGVVVRAVVGDNTSRLGRAEIRPP